MSLLADVASASHFYGDLRHFWRGPANGWQVWVEDRLVGGHAVLNSALDEWDRRVPNVAFIKFNNNGAPCSFKDGYIVVCDKQLEGAAGQTSYWLGCCDSFGQRIQGALLEIDPDWRDDQGVHCHELGHALGLKHYNNTSTCMHIDTSGSNYPNSHDNQVLNNTLYPHGD
jgi:hypothetical protein